MKFVIAAVFLLLAWSDAIAESHADFDVRAAERFASLALACIGKEYPNKISHTLNSDADVAPPRKLTPAFFGCYDFLRSTDIGCWRGWFELIPMHRLPARPARLCGRA